jgi:hypothetical protein
MMTIQSASEMLAWVSAGVGLALWVGLFVMVAAWFVREALQCFRGHGSWAGLVVMLAITILLASLWGSVTLALVAFWLGAGR